MPSTKQLNLFQSLWGMKSSQWETLFPLLKQKGFYGVEASLSDIMSVDQFSQLDNNTSPSTSTSTSTLPATPTHHRFFRLLRENNLQWICGLYTSWDDYIGEWDIQDLPDFSSSNATLSSPGQLTPHQKHQVDRHVSQFRRQLEIVVNDLPIVPFHINCHTGSDTFTEAQVDVLFHQILEIQHELLPKLNQRLLTTTENTTQRFRIAQISHETHRGRALYNPWTALRVSQRFPEIRFTLDLSHWTVVSERMLTPEVLKPVLEKTLHIHARVADPQQSQVDDPGCEVTEEDKEWVDGHLKVWKAVWGYHRGNMKDGVEALGCNGLSSATPEYGPVDEGGYMRKAVVVVAGDGEVDGDYSRTKKKEKMNVVERKALKELQTLIFEESDRLKGAF
jgi:hypothetical protein